MEENPATKTYVINLHPGKLTNVDPKNDGLEFGRGFFLLTMGISGGVRYVQSVMLQVVYHLWMSHYLQRFLHPRLFRLFCSLKKYGKLKATPNLNFFHLCNFVVKSFQMPTVDSPKEPERRQWVGCQRGGELWLLGNKFEAQVA